MIHAYNRFYLTVAMDKLGEITEQAVCEEKIPLGEFFRIFLSSPVVPALEKADPVYLCGKSSRELLALILGQEPGENPRSRSATPEYWVGRTYAVLQWYFNEPYSKVLETLPPEELMGLHFPYHELDERHLLSHLSPRFRRGNRLKDLRTEKEISQADLSVLSGVPIRSIKAYEQGSIELSSAQAETLYLLSQTLGCTIEDLIV